MQGIDLNLLPSLHALLQEEHVTRAAVRMHLSVPAMSRALERCRKAFGDPLLVRSGRNVVITPRGRELLAELDPLIAQLSAMTARPVPLDPATLRRRFTIRANEAVIAFLGSPLLELIQREAPGVGLRFQFEGDDDFDRLADGTAEIAVGAYSEPTTDLRTEHLVGETLVGVVRSGNPAANRKITMKRFAALDHVVFSRRGRALGPLDQVLAEHGLERRVVAVVPSFSAALAMVAQSDAVAIAPRRLAQLLGGPEGLTLFEVPLQLPRVEVLQVWHQRTEADQGCTWLRGCVRRAARSIGSM